MHTPWPEDTTEASPILNSPPDSHLKCRQRLLNRRLAADSGLPHKSRSVAAWKGLSVWLLYLRAQSRPKLHALGEYNKDPMMRRYFQHPPVENIIQLNGGQLVLFYRCAFWEPQNLGMGKHAKEQEWSRNDMDFWIWAGNLLHRTSP